MTTREIVEKIKNGKNLSDSEWLDIEQAILELLKTELPEEERKIFVPLGLLELVTIMCDGIRNKPTT